MHAARGLCGGAADYDSDMGRVVGLGRRDSATTGEQARAFSNLRHAAWRRAAARQRAARPDSMRSSIAVSAWLSKLNKRDLQLFLCTVDIRDETSRVGALLVYCCCASDVG